MPVEPARRFNIRSLIGENLDAAFERHQIEGERPAWDVSYVAIPSPEGMAVQGMLVITINTALLEPITAAMLMDPRSLMDADHADSVVTQALMSLRESASQALAQASGLLIP
jgi:hypothetical protein